MISSPLLSRGEEILHFLPIWSFQNFKPKSEPALTSHCQSSEEAVHVCCLRTLFQREDLGREWTTNHPDALEALQGEKLQKRVGTFKGASGSELREDMTSEGGKTVPISLEGLPSHCSLGNLSRVRCLTPRGMYYKSRTLFSFISKEKSQLTNPVCPSLLSLVILQPPGSLRFTHLSSLSVADLYLSLWHLVALSLKINSLFYEVQTPSPNTLSPPPCHTDPYHVRTLALMSHWLYPHVILSLCHTVPIPCHLSLSPRYHWPLPEYLQSQSETDRVCLAQTSLGMKSKGYRVECTSQHLLHSKFPRNLVA